MINHKIIFLSLLFFIASCSYPKLFSAPKYEQKNQKLITLTKNLQQSVNLLRCSQRQDWYDSKEKAKRLIWNVSNNESRLTKAKGILATLKQAEETNDVKKCESLLKTAKYNIRNFDEYFHKKKGVDTTHF